MGKKKSQRGRDQGGGGGGGRGRGRGGGRGGGRGRGVGGGRGRGLGLVVYRKGGQQEIGRSKENLKKSKKRKQNFSDSKNEFPENDKNSDDSESTSASDDENGISTKDKKNLSVSENSSKKRKIEHEFTPEQKILLVGEGDFSFCRALARKMGANAKKIIATAFDTEETVLEKYKGSEEILTELRESGSVLRFGIDATKLQKCLHVGKKKRKSGERGILDEPFDRIIFNFPHVGLGIKDEAVNIQKNRELLLGFFLSSIPLLRTEGQIYVTLKTGKPYEKWNVTAVAHQTKMLKLIRTQPFNPHDFPGYHHRRTIGFIEGLSAAENEEIEGQSRTFIFGPL